MSLTLYNVVLLIVSLGESQQPLNGRESGSKPLISHGVEIRKKLEEKEKNYNLDICCCCCCPCFHVTLLATIK